MIKKISTALALIPSLLMLPTTAWATTEDVVNHTPTSIWDNPFAVIAVLLFLLGYTAITLEHKFSLHKSAIALLTGSLIWLVASLAAQDHHIIEETLHNTGAEIFEIVVFLLAAMTLVEILVHYKFFDMIRMKLLRMKLDDRKQFLVISFLTFFLSAVLDNLTVTIVMTQIALRFFKKNNLLVMVASIVIMANAGGAWSPIGDVTTIMLWLAKKFTSGEIIMQGFLPALLLGVTSTFMLLPKIVSTTTDSQEDLDIKFSRSEKVVMSLALISFSFPILAHTVGLRPYLGLLFGLGLVWTAIEFFKTRSHQPSHLASNIDHLLQKVDISSLKFFIGILLAVSGLGVLGILDQISVMILGAAQETNRIIIGNIFLGLLSAIVDNVPLTALAIDLIKTQDTSLWILLALAVGTGGSVLIIGSVSGVVAMGMVKELRFDRYLKIASLPALVGYAVGMIAWYVQNMLFFS